MKKIIALLLAAFAIQSCNKDEPKPLTKEEVAQQIDSIVAERVRQVEADAQKELEYRMKIEVKIKADSILHSMQHIQDSTHADSSKQTH